MKKTALITLAAMIFSSGSAFAANESISVGEVSANKGIVSFDVKNETENASTITMTLIKIDSSKTQKQNTYYFDQQELAAKGTAAYKVEIPDTKLGDVRGSGAYTVSVQNSDGTKVTKTFGYADSIECAEFLQKLKEADKKVTSNDLAYAELLPVVEAEENKNVLFSSGVDRDEFLKESESLRRSMMNLLHQNGLSSFEKVEDFVSSFGNLYNLAVYNSGAKERGITGCFAEFDGAKTDETVVKKAAAIMQDSYSTPAEFEKAFNLAYGLALIGSSDMTDIEANLKSFAKVTGECSDEISKITALDSVKKYSVLEDLVTNLNGQTPADKSALSTQLNAVIPSDDGSGNGGNGSGNGTGGTGGGGGGGSAGSSANKTTQSTSISVRPIGTPSTEEQEYIFGDMKKSHWAAEAVTALKNKGVISGNENGDFEPERTVTREEFTKMVVQITGLELIPGGSKFSDVSADDWFAPYVNAAVEKEIINGISENLFGTGSEISRRDMAVIIDRAIKAKGEALSAKREYAAFADEAEIADYAKEAIKTLYCAEVINGRGEGKFDPNGSATRAEAAKIIYEAFKGGE